MNVWWFHVPCKSHNPMQQYPFHFPTSHCQWNLFIFSQTACLVVLMSFVWKKEKCFVLFLFIHWFANLSQKSGQFKGPGLESLDPREKEQKRRGTYKKWAQAFRVCWMHDWPWWNKTRPTIRNRKIQDILTLTRSSQTRKHECTLICR